MIHVTIKADPDSEDVKNGTVACPHLMFLLSRMLGEVARCTHAGFRDVDVLVGPDVALRVGQSREYRDAMRHMLGPAWPVWTDEYGLTRSMYGFSIRLNEQQPPGTIDMVRHASEVDPRCVIVTAEDVYQ